MITQLEIAIQSTYDTNTGSGPIASALNWECATRLNKVGAFSFEMPLGDSKRSLLVAKRYVRCYGIVNDTWTEQGKPGIIEKIARSIDGEGVPTGMIRVEGTDLFGELNDILIHELDIIDTDTRIPDIVQYYDGTATAYIDMTDAYDDNPATGVEIPADDEDWFYIGDADPFDIVTFDLGANLNDDTNNFIVQYSTGVENNFSSGTVLSDTTKVDNASFAQDGALRWERQEEWESQTNNAVDDMYWLRFRYKEDMSGDVSVNEITITQELPTATALTLWQEYIDVDGNTPISTLGWDFEATHTEAQNTVFLKLREVSAFKALAMMAEQTGENFRLGSGREIEWLQDDKTASGIVATNAIDSTAGASATTNCWITSFRQSSDAYELVGRVYPRGGGRGASRVNLLECTRTAAGGYTLSKSLNYLQKDSVESDYGRPMERSKYWPELMSPNAANAKDINVANALYDLTYQYLQRHCIPQTAYDVEVVKLDSVVPVGTTLQVAYWQTVDGSAIMDVGVDGTPIHLWVLESTQRVDNKGLRSVAMKIATTDAWPTSAGAKMQEVIYQVLAIQATDGPMSGASLTVGSVEDLLGSLDLSAYTKRASDETITGTWRFDANLSIGDDASSKVAQGLTINQGANDDIAFAIQSSDIAHGITDWADTDTYFSIVKHEGAVGGAALMGFRESGGAASGGAAMSIIGFLDENADTTKSTSGRAIVELGGYVTSGTAITNTNADGNVFSHFTWRGGAYTALWILDEDGDTWQDGALNFGEGTTIADGIVWGSDANKVTLYRSADDKLETDDAFHALGVSVGAATIAGIGEVRTSSHITVGGNLDVANGTVITWGTDTNLYRDAANLLKTDDSLTVALGFNVGRATGATAGSAYFAGATVLNRLTNTDTDNYTQISFYEDAAGSASITLPGSTFATVARRLNLELASIGGDVILQRAGNFVGIGLDDPTDELEVYAAATPRIRIDSDANGSPGYELSEAGVRKWVMYNDADDAVRFLAGSDRLILSAAAGAAFTGCVTDGTCEIFTGDALAIIADVISAQSGHIGEHGLEKWDMKYVHGKYPFLVDKIQPMDVHGKRQTRYGDRLGAKSDLLYRATMQLDGHRLTADAERKVIREQMGILENRLALLERVA